MVKTTFDQLRNELKPYIFLRIREVKGRKGGSNQLTQRDLSQTHWAKGDNCTNKTNYFSNNGLHGLHGFFCICANINELGLGRLKNVPKVGVVLAQNRARRTPFLASLLARFKERKGKERWFFPQTPFSCERKGKRKKNKKKKKRKIKERFFDFWKW